ncbi:purine-cytosine permease family protein [Stutzerimonas azotifigens]|uniref:Cytosine permease n=1 Tax=Stutzerimonas azotifigens TaxID=291995 RepID=A0ABR5YYG2_9GAMM|nr:cytosine permease [Stutzerimonas azotifigens]MBA1272977.1 cytosine permease [Stutzerimonas azotifigens]
MFRQLTQYFGQDSLAATDRTHRSLGMPGTLALWLGANVVVTTILTGMLLVPDLPFGQAMLIVLLGSAIGILPLVLVGLMGQRSGLSTMVLARGSYGLQGAKLPSLVNLLSLLAWSWIQALLAGMSLNFAVQALTGYSNLALFTILCEALVVLIALRGHLGIERVERWAALGMVLLAGAVFYAMGQHFEFAELLAMPAEPRNEITAGIAFDIVIATAFSWIPLAADYNRNCRTQKVAAVGTWVGYVLATLLAMGMGAAVSGFSVLSGMEQTYDPAVLLAGFGFGLPAAIVVFLSVMTTNVMCVYSASLSYLNIRPQTPFWKPALVIGLLSIAGSQIPGILDNFQTFLLVIGSVFIPAFAVLIADYFVIHRGDYDEGDLLRETGGRYGYRAGINPAAYAAYGLGALLAYYWGWVSPLAFGASLPVFVLTAVLYVVLRKWVLVPRVQVA